MPTANSTELVRGDLASAKVAATMRAAVYRGAGTVAVEQVPTPSIGPGELLIRVEACGICHTDLKKIEYNLLPPPRIYGHETAGVVAAVGAGVTQAITPATASSCFTISLAASASTASASCMRSAPVYKKVGVTAGFEPAGGGFAQYVRVMDWIVRTRHREDSGRCFLRPGQLCRTR